jgi:hypothetical protein
MAESLDVSTWTKVSPADSGLSFYMPETPTEQKRTVPVGEGELEMLQFVHSFGDGGALAATYSGLPADQARTSEAVLKSARDRVVEAVRGRLLSEDNLKSGDVPGIELHIRVTDETSSRQRMYVNDGRFYQFIAVGPKEFLRSPDTEKFFRAVRFDEMPER